ncbi:hypothetical protein [Nitrincola sp.]|uniref:hypothetical protein n=1 Tax=Nitrincola sp. TaxID=1926584 RepID=UPI003A92A91A
MKRYMFSLVLSNVSIDTPGLEDRLFEAGCDDALLCFYGKTVYLEFDRNSSSLEDAILSAIKNIESAGLGAKVVSVDAGDYVGLSDIAALSDSSRQAIALLKDGKRGPGQFPNPVLRLTSQQPLWRWGEVAQWLYAHNRIDSEVAHNAQIIENFNLALELREPKKCDQVLTLVHTLNEFVNEAV